MISTIRTARAHAQDKAPFDALIEELSAQSPEFRDWWQDTEVKGFNEGRKRLLHPTSGHIEFTYFALTGSMRAGSAVAATAGKALKRRLLELGGVLINGFPASNARIPG